DVIVNTTSSSMNLNIGGMSSALSKKAGPALQAAVNKKKASPVNDIIDTETAGCNLSCKRVYHVSLDIWQSTMLILFQKMTKVVMDCLKLADKSKLQSISLPALGTGILSYPPQKVAAIMLGAAIQFSKDNPNSTLQLIQFVLLPSNNETCLIKLQFLQKVTYLSPHNSTWPSETQTKSNVLGWVRKLCLHFRKYIMKVAANNKTQIKIGDMEISSHQTDVIVNTTSPTMDLNVGAVSSALSRKAGPALQAAVNSTLAVSLYEMSTFIPSGLEACPSIILQRAGKLKKVVMDCLKLADKSKLQSISLPALGTGILSYPPQKVAAIMLGAAIQFSKDNPNSTLQLIQFVLLPSNNLNVFTHTFSKGTLSASARRRSSFNDLMLKYPENWEPMEGKQHQIITVDEKSKEYASVKKNFTAACPSVTRIISIKRIQNLRLYRAYLVMEKSIESKSTGGKYDHVLFHGTDNDAIKNINHNGYNRVYKGKNATVYGEGTYFAKDSGFSHLYTNPDKNGHRFMYQARVLTGAYCVGSSEMKEPPLKIKNGTERFDSVVDSVTSPRIFVVFHDDQAYPEYLIEYL
uniref:Poly [ADP-ribose] polymerase n=1 Tax=Petromyzon marinus TaxID=7757 RepID=S4RG32_PETMA